MLRCLPTTLRAVTALLCVATLGAVACGTEPPEPSAKPTQPVQFAQPAQSTQPAQQAQATPPAQPEPPVLATQNPPATQAKQPDTATATGAPRVTVDTMRHDWGSLVRGESFSCVFVFTNKGTAPLRITHVKPSCGCTTQNWTRGPIAPGATGEVALTIDTTKLERGPQEKLANILTNDPKQPNLQVKIGGEVLTVFKTDPEILTLADLHTAKKSGTIDLLPGAGRSFEIKEVRPSLGAVKIDKIETLEAGARYRLHVSAPPSGLPGVKPEQLRVKVVTANGVEHEDTVKVVVQHLKRMLIEPLSLQFKAKETACLYETPAKPVVKELRIKGSTDEIRFRVLRVSVGGAAQELFEPELVTITEGREYLIRVRIHQPFAGRVVRGTLQIETDDMAEPLQTVRIFGQFRPPAKSVSK